VATVGQLLAGLRLRLALRLLRGSDLGLGIVDRSAHHGAPEVGHGDVNALTAPLRDDREKGRVPPAAGSQAP
jgi:hypothetical protein